MLRTIMLLMMIVLEMVGIGNDVELFLFCSKWPHHLLHFLKCHGLTIYYVMYSTNCNSLHTFSNQNPSTFTSLKLVSKQIDYPNLQYLNILSTVNMPDFSQIKQSSSLSELHQGGGQCFFEDCLFVCLSGSNITKNVVSGFWFFFFPSGNARSGTRNKRFDFFWGVEMSVMKVRPSV